MNKIYKTLQQEAEEQKQKEYSRDMAKAKKQVEKQKLLLLLENQVKTYLKQIENKNINLYDFNFSTYAKTEIINIVLMQYEQKDKFYLDYKDYYFKAKKDDIPELERLYRQDDNVIKFIVIKTEF